MRERPASYPLEVREALQTAPAPIVRRGRASASMVLHNPGNERVVMRTARVRDLDGLRTVAGDTFDVRTSAIVRSNSSSRVAIGFDTPATAAPGTYRFAVAVGDVEEIMSLDVPLRAEVHIRPALLVVTGSGTTTHQITVENRGNIDVSVAGAIAAPLDDSLILCRALRGGLSLFDEVEREEDVTAERLFVRAAKAAHDALDGAVLKVRFLPDVDPITPGAATRVLVEVETPSSLDPRTRYTAAIPILNATLGVVVVPTKVATVASTPRPATRANKRQPRPSDPRRPS